MPKVITKYKCDFCKRMYANEDNAKKHEQKCYSNPSTRSCITCGNLVVKKNEQNWTEYGERVNLVYYQTKCKVDAQPVDEDNRNCYTTNCHLWTENKNTDGYQFGKFYLEIVE